MNYDSFVDIYIYVFLIFALGVSTESGSVKYQDCGSTANVTDFRVTGCTVPPCVFIKGQRYDIEIDAISNCQSQTLPYKVTAKLLFPFTILKGNACDVLSKGKCPISNGQDFTYKNVINVSTSYPSFHTKVKAVVQNDAKQNVICLVLDVNIRKKYNSRKQWIL